MAKFQTNLVKNLIESVIRYLSRKSAMFENNRLTIREQKNAIENFYNPSPHDVVKHSGANDLLHDCQAKV